MPGAGTRLCEALVSLSHPECSPHIHTHTHTHTHKQIRDAAAPAGVSPQPWGASAPSLGRKACGTTGSALAAAASHPQEPESQGSRVSPRSQRAPFIIKFQPGCLLPDSFSLPLSAVPFHFLFLLLSLRLLPIIWCGYLSDFEQFPTSICGHATQAGMQKSKRKDVVKNSSNSSSLLKRFLIECRNIYKCLLICCSSPDPRSW